MQFNSTKYYAFLLCCLAAPISLFAKDVKVNDAQQLLQHNDLHFIENKGQITDQHHKARRDIQYKISGGAMNVFVGNGQLHYQVSNTENDKVNSYRMDVVLKNANSHAQVITAEKQSYFERYLNPRFGKDGLTVAAYNRITYKDVYPDIDWVLYIKNNRLEYDFVVRPGGNVNDIQLAYKGAEQLEMNTDGAVIATTPAGTVTEKTPYAYVLENGKQVASKFKVAHNTLSFDVAAYDGTIVIDPVIDWSTYYGSTGSDIFKSVATDATGSIYAAGSTSSANIATLSGYQSSFGGGASDAFLIKFDPSGNLAWATYFGGTGTDVANGVTCDPSGNVYITGSTNSTTGMTDGNAYQVALGVTSPGMGGMGGGVATIDAFLAKFDGNGNILWATYVGGNNTDVAKGVACDVSGNVYIAGYTLSSQNLATQGAFQTTIGGGSTYGDVLLAKFDGAGNNQWVTYYGGTTSDAASGIVCDASSNIYITGITGSNAVIATTGAYQTTYTGPNGQVGDAFLSKFTTGGTLAWGTYYGGANYEVATGITMDAANNLYITGSTNSTSGISTIGGTLSGTTDGYLAKFNLSGNIIWGNYFGGTGADSSYSVSTDVQDNVYVTGNTASSTGIATTNAYLATGVGFNNGYLMEFNSAGQKLYGTYIGGAGATMAYSVANFRGANPFTVMTGTTTTPNSIATTGAWQTTYSGGQEGFITRFNIDTNVSIRQPYTDTALCAGGVLTVHDTTNYPFRAGNTFTVQLSNAAGSFATPVNISPATPATTSGSIVCTIPAGTIVGTGYRIRIIATNPAYTSADDDINIHIVSSISAPTVTYNSPVCVGDSLKFTVTPTSALTPLTYSWTGPVSFTANVQNAARASITAAMAGVYTVTTAHAGCPSVNATVPVSINSTIPATPTAGSNSPVCAGQTLNLTSSSTTSGVTYAWTGPNNYTSTAQNPVYTSVPVSASGSYFVTSVLNGCHSVPAAVAVTVNSTTPPDISITALNGDTVCFGADANFMATATNGGNNPHYQWYVNDIAQIGAISDVWGSPYFVGSGTQVYCILTSNVACVANPVDTSNIITVEVLSPQTPSVTITANPGNTVPMGTGVTFSTSVIGGGTVPAYQWQLNGVDVAGETYSTYTSHLLNEGDVVTVTVVSNAPCAQPDTVTSNAVTIHIGTGVAQVSAFNDVVLYPNPNSGTFNVKGSLNDINGNDVSIEILNAVGQVVYQHTATVQNGALNEPVTLNSSVADGIYLLRLNAGDQSKVFRFTLQR